MPTLSSTRTEYNGVIIQNHIIANNRFDGISCWWTVGGQEYYVNSDILIKKEFYLFTTVGIYKKTQAHTRESYCCPNNQLLMREYATNMELD